MDDGQVGEFDTPDALLSNPSSALCQLATSTGLANAAQLRAVARGVAAGTAAGDSPAEEVSAPADAAAVGSVSHD